MNSIRFPVRSLLIVLLLLSFGGTAPAAEPITLRVMTYNLWHGGDAGKQPLSATVDVICKAKADVVGLQETAGTAPKRRDNKTRSANSQRPRRRRVDAAIVG